MSNLKRLGMFNRAGMKACNSGNSADAMFQLTQAYSIAKLLKSPLHEAKIRNNMGLLHHLSGKPEEALSCFRLAEKSAIAGAGPGNRLHTVIKRNIERVLEGKAA